MTKYLDSWKQEVMKEYVDSYQQKQKKKLASSLFDNIQDQINANQNLNVAGRRIPSSLVNPALTETEAEDYIKSADVSEMTQLLEEIETEENTTIVEHYLENLNRFVSVIDNFTKYDKVFIEQFLEITNLMMEEGSLSEITTLFDKVSNFIDLYESSTQCRVLKSIYLFSGQAVQVVREPGKFNPDMTGAKIFPNYSLSHSLHFTNSLRAQYYRDNDSALGALEKIQKVLYFIFTTARDNKISTISSYLKQYVGYLKLLPKDKNDTKDYFTDEIEKEEKLRENLKSLNAFFRTITKPITDKISKYGNLKKDDYQSAKDFLEYISQYKNNSETANISIYRGLAIALYETEELSLSRDTADKTMGIDFDEGFMSFVFSEEMEQLLKSEMVGKTLNVGSISSWSKSQNVAEGFALSTMEPDISKIPCLLVSPFSRGLGIKKFSVYKEEDEVITGGVFKIEDVSVLRILTNSYDNESQEILLIKGQLE